MKEFKREYPLFSLCGLNCGLCPRYHTDGSSRCPGCGGEGFFIKHPSCGIISCSQRHGGIEYCCFCEEYPCKKYDGADASDSFISHRNQLKDFDKAKNAGLDIYISELNEKVELLQDLLENYNDGKRKNFYCVAVNLLELNDIREIMSRIDGESAPQGSTLKEKAAEIVSLFEMKAEKRNISLVLRKKGAGE